MRSKLLLFIIVSLLAFACGHKSGRKDKQNSSSHNISQPIDNKDEFKGKTIVKMENTNGVKYVWIEINGLKLKFIFRPCKFKGKMKSQRRIIVTHR